ncbi:hypothetical protein D3C85_1142850 [compost metagenome]
MVDTCRLILILNNVRKLSTLSLIPLPTSNSVLVDKRERTQANTSVVILRALSKCTLTIHFLDRSKAVAVHGNNASNEFLKGMLHILKQHLFKECFVFLQIFFVPFRNLYTPRYASKGHLNHV